jgi:hypothetical protein
MYHFLFVRLMQVKNISESQVEWLVADYNGKILELSKQPELLSDILVKNLADKKLIIIIPDQVASYHLAELPIKDAKKRAQAAEYILEEKIISGLEQTKFAMGPEICANKYLVAAVDKQILADILTELREKFNIVPDKLLTDALCLYEKANKNTDKNDYYKIYLNQQNNLSIIINENIIVSQLSNLNLIIDQLPTNVTIELYKHNLNNSTEYFGKNITRISIHSDQDITDWLSFLAQSWLKNREYNKINLISGLVKKNRLDIKFNKWWVYIAALWVIIFFGFIFYKYTDYAIFNDKNTELNNLTKRTLASVEINSIDLNKSSILLDRQVNNLTAQMQQERLKDTFYILKKKMLINYSSCYIKTISKK